MNKIRAIMRKEYLETRSTTLLLACLGVLIPLFQYCYSQFAKNVDWNPSSFVVAAGIAVWLNATLLCAMTVSREFEDGTIDTLRRVAPNWKIAIAGKLATIFLSTLALVAFFGALLAVVRACGVADLFSSSFFYSLDSPDNFGMKIKACSLLFAFCWGVFWTSRTSKQSTAIILATLTPLACGFLVEALYNLVAHYANERLSFSTASSAFRYIEFVALALVPIASLVALYFAPKKNRFGYAQSDSGWRFASKRAARAADSSFLLLGRALERRKTVDLSHARP